MAFKTRAFGERAVLPLALLELRLVMALITERTAGFTGAERIFRFGRVVAIPATRLCRRFVSAGFQKSYLG